MKIELNQHSENVGHSLVTGATILLVVFLIVSAIRWGIQNSSDFQSGMSKRNWVACYRYGDTQYDWAPVDRCPAYRAR